MIQRTLSALQSSMARIVFLLLALGCGVWAVVSQWNSIVAAIALADPWLFVIALPLSLLYVVGTFFAWLTLLRVQAQELGGKDAARVFFVSQLGKYLPGGIWNILAAAELGRDHSISRLQSVVVMLQSTMISIATGLILGAAGVLIGSPELRANTWWVVLALPLFVLVLMPPVLNRITGFIVRLTRCESVGIITTWRSVGVASLWSTLAWTLAGAQVWLLGIGLGLEISGATLGLCVLVYALAWTVGFLAVIAPAGIGVREGILAILLAGQLTGGGIVALVLLSRVLFTVADVLLGLTFLRRKQTPTRSMR